MGNNLVTDSGNMDVFLTSYKSYIAILTQTGTQDPVATVFNSSDSNYIGDIVWTRDAAGTYLGTLEGAFTVGKTVFPPFGNRDSGVLLPISFETKGYYQLTSPVGGVNYVILVTVSDLDYNLVEFSTIGGSIYVDIKVYK